MTNYAFPGRGHISLFNPDHDRSAEHITPVFSREERAGLPLTGDLLLRLLDEHVEQAEQDYRIALEIAQREIADHLQAPLDQRALPALSLAQLEAALREVLECLSAAWEIRSTRERLGRELDGMLADARAEEEGAAYLAELEAEVAHLEADDEADDTLVGEEGIARQAPQEDQHAGI